MSVPEPVAYVRDLLRGFDAPWVLCGGWAADAWLGTQTREHGDVDIAVFHGDQAAIARRFEGWVLIGHDPNVPDDTDERWPGRHLDLPAHIHVPTPASPLAGPADARHSAVEFEFLLNERAGDDLVVNTERRIAVPIGRAVRESPWGLPTLAPEVILFYKGRGDHTVVRDDPFRPRDEQDFHALLPILGPAEKVWLRDSLAAVLPTHPWLPRLG